MTDIDITPELLRGAASILEENDFFGAAGFLRNESIRIERQQAAEKRIDELAQEFVAIRKEYTNSYFGWDSIDDGGKDAIRAGIRGVLAKLDEYVVDAELYGVRDNGDVLLTASDAASVKAVLRFVFGRNNGEPYPAADIETLKFYFWPEMSNTIGGSK